MSIDTVSLTAALVVKLVAKPDEADARSRAPSPGSRCAPTRPPSGSSMPFRPTLSVRSTWRARSQRPCSPMQNDSWTGHQRSSRPRSSPPSCPSESSVSRGRVGDVCSRPTFETTRRLPARIADALVRHAASCRPGYGPAIMLGLPGRAEDCAER